MDYSSCLCACAPTQILNIDIAINDVSLLEIFDNNGNKIDNCCLEWSYSLDGIEWTCWMSYDDMQKMLFDIKSDFFVKTKINTTIGSVKYDGNIINRYSASLASCFEFGPLKDNPNNYNPYNNTEYASGLYNQLSETVSSIVGIPVYYFKLNPNYDSKDITFKEYTLLNIESVKQIKLIVKDGIMPSSKPEFNEWGFDFSTDWETEITKLSFATAFGNNALPMEGDLVYIPMMKRMWMVNGAYEEKNDGFMWNASVFKVALVKYQEKASVDLGDTQAFVDTLVKTKYDDLFGTEENVMSGTETTNSPSDAYLPVYPVYESDAVRKYVKHTNQYNPGETIVYMNAKLIYNPSYNNGIIVSDNMYDWREVTDESFVIYQKQYCGENGSFSFIIEPGTNGCEGQLLNIGGIIVNINSTPKKTKLSIFNIIDIEFNNNGRYFVYGRWNRKLNIIEMGYAEYKYPENIPLYKLENFHYYFDMDNITNKVAKYNNEMVQSEKQDVTLYSFDGKITNIKIYDIYQDNLSELLQMLPTNQHLIINDVARKFVELAGIRNR